MTPWKRNPHVPCHLTILPWSLPKAMSDPVKVTPPMYVPRNRAVLMTLAAGSVAKWGCSTMKLAMQVSTAAAPTRLWNSATIWGRSVTSIRLAAMAPMLPPGVIKTEMDWLTHCSLVSLYGIINLCKHYFMNQGWLIVNWTLMKTLLSCHMHYHVTFGCRYNAFQYDMILHTSLLLPRQNINQSVNPQNTPHTSP